MNLFDSNLTIQNNLLLIRPMLFEDIGKLARCIDASIWKHTSTSIKNPSDWRNYAALALEEYRLHKKVPLVIQLKETQELIGSTSLGNISYRDRRLEIGWTWLGLFYQGKGYNYLVKFQILEYLFLTTQFDRIEFRTRNTNLKSIHALKRIGAKQEAVLRSYFVDNNTRYDMLYFSIVRSEWPPIKESFFHSW